MWKTRFEVSTNHNHDLTRHRNLLSSSSIIHHYYSGPSPTVPRVRENSPSAIVRPSPPSSSIPNLESLLEEEDEDIPSSNLIHNEQTNLVSITLPKQNLSTKRQIVLPTILESNDHENEFNQYSFVATNTNYNQMIQVDIEKKEQRLNKPNQKMEFTLDKRIKEILQQKNKVREVRLFFASPTCQ